MKWKKKKRKIILCPKCKRPTLVHATNVSGWLDSKLYTCNSQECDYVGRFYITIDPSEIMKDSPEDQVDDEDDDG